MRVTGVHISCGSSGRAFGRDSHEVLMFQLFFLLGFDVSRFH